MERIWKFIKMANTKLTDVSPDGKVALSAGEETRVPALGDGTAKPGDAVGIVGATGKVVQCDVGVSILFIGFLEALRSDSIDIDDAIVDGVPCEIVVPRSAHEYACKIEDPAGNEYEGQPYLPSDNAGSHEAAATLTTAGVNSVLAATVLTGDVYGKIRWL